MSTSALVSPLFRVALVQDQPGETPVVKPMDAASATRYSNSRKKPLPDKEKAPMSGLKGVCLPVYKVVLVRERAGPHYAVRRANAAARVFARFFAGFDREGFAVALLDTKLKLIGLNTVSIGTLNQSIVTGREVFKPAILSSAFGILVAHNHPSGSVLPSLFIWRICLLETLNLCQ